MFELLGTLFAVIGGIPLLLGGAALIIHLILPVDATLQPVIGPHDSWRSPRFLSRRRRLRAFPRQLRA